MTASDLAAIARWRNDDRSHLRTLAATHEARQGRWDITHAWAVRETVATPEGPREMLVGYFQLTPRRGWRWWRRWSRAEVSWLAEADVYELPTLALAEDYARERRCRTLLAEPRTRRRRLVAQLAGYRPRGHWWVKRLEQEQAEP